MSIRLKIIDMGMDAVGVGKYNDKIVFVPGALTGEEVAVDIVKENKNFCNAKLLEIISASPYRVEPKCPYYYSCGGCNLSHASYDFALNYKTNYITNLAKKMLGRDVKVNPTVPSQEYHYRNKQVFNISKQNGKIVVGTYSEQSHNSVDIDECLLDDGFSKQLISATKEFVQDNKISVYDQTTKNGLLRYVMARKLENKLLIVLVTTHNFEKAKCFVDVLKKYFDNFSLDLNINSKIGSVILTNEYVHIYGDSNIESTYCDRECKIKYTISPNSFLQVNNHIRDLIYQNVSRECYGFDQVVDAYSGAGLMSAIISQSAKQVYGLEIVKSATNDANALKQLNNINNLTNINTDCAVWLENLLNKQHITNFCLILDPPRKGVDQSVVNTVLNTLPQKIIYVSCNPATLMRDLKNILQGQYEIEYITPYDMFAQTSHIECVAVLKLKQ